MNNNNDNNNNNNTAVCTDFGAWTTEFKDDASLERQSRTLVMAYKIEKVYGEWSAASKTAPTNTNGIEVKTIEGTEKVLVDGTWSEASTTKPEEKTNREIKTSTKSVPYKSKSCKKVTTTYTKEMSKYDTNAKRCDAIVGKYMKFNCTYTKTENKCTTTTKYKNVTYYSYRDKVENEVKVTLYQTRTVTDNTVYTDYILESEIPAGYTKLSGSELTQYRYRQICSK